MNTVCIQKKRTELMTISPRISLSKSPNFSESYTNIPLRDDTQGDVFNSVQIPPDGIWLAVAGIRNTEYGYTQNLYNVKIESKIQLS